MQPALSTPSAPPPIPATGLLSENSRPGFTSENPALDRLTQKATPESTLNYTYDGAGNLASMTSADGVVNVSYTWDSQNRLSTVVDSRTGTTTYTYDNASNVATVTYPNGQQATFQYDQENRVTGLSSQPASYTYQRGPTGNLQSASESSGRQASWSFDGIYRLTGETVANDPSRVNGTVGYTLDPVGNRLQQSSSLSGVSSLSFSYSADDDLPQPDPAP